MKKKSSKVQRALGVANGIVARAKRQDDARRAAGIRQTRSAIIAERNEREQAAVLAEAAKTAARKRAAQERAARDRANGIVRKPPPPPARKYFDNGTDASHRFAGKLWNGAMIRTANKNSGLERSDDDGATWQTVFTAEQFTCGSVQNFRRLIVEAGKLQAPMIKPARTKAERDAALPPAKVVRTFAEKSVRLDTLEVGTVFTTPAWPEANIDGVVCRVERVGTGSVLVKSLDPSQRLKSSDGATTLACSTMVHVEVVK
jgi:hypothetical protein